MKEEWGLRERREREESLNSTNVVFGENNNKYRHKIIAD